MPDDDIIVKTFYMQMMSVMIVVLTLVCGVSYFPFVCVFMQV